MSVAPFEFDYRVREPSGELGRLVESIWYARGTVPYTREKIAPTGSTVAIFVLGDPILEVPDNGRGEAFCAERGLILGPHDGPVINEPKGETFAVGIVTRAVGCEALFAVPPRRLRGRVLDLESVWPQATALRQQLLERSEPEAMLDVIAAALEARAAEAPHASPRFERAERAVAMLDADPLRAISDIAAELEISHAYLYRELAQIVGLTPRSLARLLRMRRLLGSIDVRGDVPWAELAAEHGWFDQAHLIRDFKRHTGVTPSAYIAAQRANFTPQEAGDGAGFVPEP